MANEIAGFGGLFCFVFFLGGGVQTTNYIYIYVILSKITLKKCNKV